MWRVAENSGDVKEDNREGVVFVDGGCGYVCGKGAEFTNFRGRELSRRIEVAVTGGRC